MLGEHVMTQADLTEELAKPDSIGLGSYFMDSHRVARVLMDNGDVATEGGVGGNTLPYEISYQSITPKAQECRNLLVPVCMSSSGVAWCSIRMEPQFMIMGHSAGVAAAIAAQQGVDVQDVPYDQLEAKLLEQGQVLDHSLSPSDDMKGVVVDDVDMGFRGNWVPATSASHFIGPRYIHDGNNNKGESAVRFVPQLPNDGLYAVRLHFMPHPNRARNVPVTIRAADGVHHYQLDQRTLPEGEESRYIATHRFDGGNAGSVILANTGTDGYVTIDAVQFIPVKEPLPGGLEQVDAPEQDEEHGWSTRLIGMKGQPRTMAEIGEFFPCFDQFGQYVHRDWQGKIHNDTELQRQRFTEQSRLDAGPENWSKFGGYTAGPRLEATGFFRTEKHGGRWWLVDPEGYLFFSHGVNCVRKMDPTPVERREDWFAEKPWEQPGMEPFVLTEVRAVKYDFAGTTPLSFNFTWANLQRKYGSNWDELSGEVAHRRLRSWGFNTIGNWSHEPTYLMRQTPYTVNLGFAGPALQGSPRGFRDPYDPRYAKAIVERLQAEQGMSLNDPWCLGYFVDNELPWGSEHALGAYTLQSPADQPAKLAMVEMLKEKHQTIAALNKAWDTDHGSWDALLADTTAPETPAAIADQEAFHREFARTYFRTTREAIKSVAPDMLYLGARFHTRNDPAREAAAEFCDVISYNTYADTPDSTLDDFDVPMMITEYSFGATDVGLFYGGGNEVKTQADRVAGYEQFIEHALAHPSVVGAHWFQFTDQPASGRTLEGENGQYGLVDIVDTPYAELTQATRRFANRVYEELLK